MFIDGEIMTLELEIVILNHRRVVETYGKNVLLLSFGYRHTSDSVTVWPRNRARDAKRRRLYYLFVVAEEKKAKGFLMPAPIDTRFSTNDSLIFYLVHDALGFPLFDAVFPWKAKHFYFAGRPFSLATLRSMFLKNFRFSCCQIDIF